ncbi:MAG: 2-phosphosulfolactate phosphatase [Desulfarculaceae bacterium]
MRAHILSMQDDLEAVSGPVVILDIFRASNTIISLLTSGADRVLLESDLQTAYDHKTRHPDWLLWGERGGTPPRGFDGGNSPDRAAGQDLRGQTVVLTTSAGTQAVHRFGRAKPIWFASFANAQALKTAMAHISAQTVSLLPMGFEAREPALEDSLAAQYLKDLIEGKEPDFDSLKDRIISSPGAERLCRLGQDRDLVFCTTLDSHHLLPIVQFQDHPFAVAWEPPLESNRP